MQALWWFTRGPAVYPEAEEFKPERYSEPYNERSPTHLTFGYGRRVCTGRYLADVTLFLISVQYLAVFDFKPAVGEHEKGIVPKYRFLPGVRDKGGVEE